MTTRTFVPRTDADALAWEIAQAFQDEANLMQYRRVCATHDRSFVYVTYKEVMAMPREKIRKSRPAIFFHIIRNHDNG